MRRAATLLALLAMAGCSPSYPIKPGVPQTPSRAPSRAPPKPPAQTPAPAPSPQPEAPPLRSPIPQPPLTRADSCGAAELQGLVGRPRTEIPIPINPNLQRVACTTCPVTDDVNPARLNFFFDANTGLIKQVRCG